MSRQLLTLAFASSLMPAIGKMFAPQNSNPRFRPLPILLVAYILDMNVRTAGAYGINEGLLASVLGALVFSVLSVQPLTIVGITGLINLFNYTVFDILKGTGVDYLQFQAWVLM